MDSLVTPLILTKLHLPAVQERRIPRTRLVDLLSSGSGDRFVLVCAPAGYGKTTLLTEWAQSLKKNDTAVAWYALDQGDDDPIPFMSYVVTSLFNALGPISELTQIAQLLRASPELDIQQILPRMINAVFSCNQDFVLILDDYHLISSPIIHQAIVFLIEHLPGNMRIAIGSRTDPPFSLARLRAGGQLLEVRTTDLRFTSDETTRFLNQVMQLDLSPEGITKLESRTEGWIAGLQLAGLSLSGRPDKESVIASFSGSHRYLVEYLIEEVFNRQSEEVQAFLLSTSILERLCAPLCDCILNTPSHSEAILTQLEQANLFVVALDDKNYWYRYHHLFREFLQTRLKKTHAERIALLHRAACEWLAENNLLREAARHAFQTLDWPYAATFVETHSFDLILHSEISTIYEWCAALPEEVIQNNPMLCILQGLALSYGFRRQNRARVEMRLHQADQIINKIGDPEAASPLIELGSVVRTFLSFAPNPMADPQEIFTLANRFLDVYPEGDPARFSGLLLAGYAHLKLHDAQVAAEIFEAARQTALQAGLYFGIVESTFHLARLAHSQGELRHAEELCLQTQADISAVLTNPDQELPALGSLDILLGCIAMEHNQLDEADRYLHQGLLRMGGGMNPYYLMTAYVALFRLSEMRGRTDEAMKYLTHLEAVWPDLAFLTTGLRLIHVLRRSPVDPRMLAEITKWCDEFSPSIIHSSSPGMGPLGAAEAYYMAFLEWVHAKVVIGQGASVRPYLEKQLNQATAQHLTHREIELSLLDALVRQSEGDDEGAQNAVSHALTLGYPEGYIRIFNRGPALTQLLIQLARQGIHKEYVDKILAAQSKIPDGEQGDKISCVLSSQMLFGEALSVRELEILRLIAQGTTNQEIADQLVISVGTVKSHINHILRKLDSHNRTEAVARARGLGLLDN